MVSEVTTGATTANEPPKKNLNNDKNDGAVEVATAVSNDSKKKRRKTKKNKSKNKSSTGDQNGVVGSDNTSTPVKTNNHSGGTDSSTTNKNVIQSIISNHNNNYHSRTTSPNNNNNKNKNNKRKRNSSISSCNSHGNQTNNYNYNHNNKRRRYSGKGGGGGGKTFWIQSCRDGSLSKKKIKKGYVHLKITRIDLTDSLLPTNDSVKEVVKDEHKQFKQEQEDTTQETTNSNSTNNDDTILNKQELEHEQPIHDSTSEAATTTTELVIYKVSSLSKTKKRTKNDEDTDTNDEEEGEEEVETTIREENHTLVNDGEKPMFPENTAPQTETETETTNNDNPNKKQRCCQSFDDVTTCFSSSPPFVYIEKSSNVKHPPPPPRSVTGYVELPNGNCGDGICNPLKEVDNKYWAQRRRLFTRFDLGIQLDTTSWYSVTPESIATHIASKVSNMLKNQRKRQQQQESVFLTQKNQQPSPPSKNKEIIVLDLFCGCGGNAIAFARQSHIDKVVCVDVDPNKLQMLAHNAQIYNIPSHKLLLIQGDGLEILSQYYKQGKLQTPTRTTTTDPMDNKQETTTFSTSNKGKYQMGGYKLLPFHIDAIFLSPPWGGPKYSQNGTDVPLKDCAQIKREGCHTLTTHTTTTSTTTAHVNNNNGVGNNVVNEVNGVDLLHLAWNSAPSSSSPAAGTNGSKNIVYFLPKNVNGISVGHAAAAAAAAAAEASTTVAANNVKKKYQKDNSDEAKKDDDNNQQHHSSTNPLLMTIEMEQNVLNGKLKTITAYFFCG